MLFTTGCHIHFEQSSGFYQVAHSATYFQMKMMVCIFLGIEYHKLYVYLNNAPWYICQLRSYTSILTEVITNLYLPTPTNIFGYY